MYHHGMMHGCFKFMFGRKCLTSVTYILRTKDELNQSFNRMLRICSPLTYQNKWGSRILKKNNCHHPYKIFHFLPNTPGSSVPFILDSGSVQLVPSVSNIHSPTFSAFLVLSETLQADEGEITFICNLVPVNNTEFARETIENPNCVFTQPVQPSSTISPPSGSKCLLYAIRHLAQ